MNRITRPVSFTMPKRTNASVRKGNGCRLIGSSRVTKPNPYEVRVYRCQSYETWPVRWQCSSSKTGRTVQIHPNHGALVRQREKLRDEKMRAMLKQRGSTVEPVFGWIKEAMGFRRWDGART